MLRLFSRKVVKTSIPIKPFQSQALKSAEGRRSQAAEEVEEGDEAQQEEQFTKMISAGKNAKAVLRQMYGHDLVEEFEEITRDLGGKSRSLDEDAKRKV
jgi:hypothetical protein